MLSASAQRKTVNNAFKTTFLFVSMDGTIVTIKLRGTLYAFVCKCATEKHNSERATRTISNATNKMNKKTYSKIPEKDARSLLGYHVEDVTDEVAVDITGYCSTRAGSKSDFSAQRKGKYLGPVIQEGRGSIENAEKNA